MSFDRTLFRATLQTHLTKNSLSIHEAAKEAGVSAATMSRIASGKLPDIESFTKLVEWLRIDANLFLHNPEGIPTESEQWAWLYLCLEELDMPKDVIEAIVTIVKVIRKKKKEKP